MKKALITLLLIPLALNLLAQTNEKMEQIRARKHRQVRHALKAGGKRRGGGRHLYKRGDGVHKEPHPRNICRG